MTQLKLLNWLLEDRPPFAVDRCPAALVKDTIQRHHYLQRWPDGRALPFALRLSIGTCPKAPDGRPWGVIVWKKPQHQCQTGLFRHPWDEADASLPTAWQVLDLARVWVHPCLQNLTWEGTDRSGRLVVHKLCIFSRMVNLAIRRVQRDWLDHHPPKFPELPYHVELLISYCDRKHHQGTGYKASGFTFHGPTADGTKDLYIRRLKPPRWQKQARQADLFQEVR